MEESSFFVVSEMVPPVSDGKIWAMHNTHEVCCVQTAYKKDFLNVYEYRGFMALPYSDIKDK